MATPIKVNKDKKKSKGRAPYDKIKHSDDVISNLVRKLNGFSPSNTSYPGDIKNLANVNFMKLKARRNITYLSLNKGLLDYDKLIVDIGSVDNFSKLNEDIKHMEDEEQALIDNDTGRKKAEALSATVTDLNLKLEGDAKLLLKKIKIAEDQVEELKDKRDKNSIHRSLKSKKVVKVAKFVKKNKTTIINSGKVAGILSAAAAVRSLSNSISSKKGD